MLIIFSKEKRLHAVISKLVGFSHTEILSCVEGVLRSGAWHALGMGPLTR